MQNMVAAVAILIARILLSSASALLVFIIHRSSHQWELLFFSNKNVFFGIDLPLEKKHVLCYNISG